MAPAPSRSSARPSATLAWNAVELAPVVLVQGPEGSSRSVPWTRCWRWPRAGPGGGEVRGRGRDLPVGHADGRREPLALRGAQVRGGARRGGAADALIPDVVDYVAARTRRRPW
ncbi:hypothetical protein NKG05_24965 [Oerskovia sp. M15]